MSPPHTSHPPYLLAVTSFSPAFPPSLLGVDGAYSTAPNSPTNSSLTLPASDLRRDSYDQAITKNPDMLWDWHSGPGDADPRNNDISDKIKDQSSPPVPKHISSVPRHTVSTSADTTRGGSNSVPAVISSSNTSRVQIGFDPPINATSLSSLPGNTDNGSASVITSPPPLTNKTSSNTSNSSSKHVLQKPRSIEETDEHRQNYIPPDNIPHGDHRGIPGSPETNAFCLDLSSITGHYVTTVAAVDETTLHNSNSKVTETSHNNDKSVIDGEPRPRSARLSSHHSNSSTSSSNKGRSLSFDLRDVVSYTMGETFL